MRTIRTNAIIFSGVLALLLAGCGGSQTTAQTSGEGAQAAGGAGGPVKPKRQVSKEAKEDFVAAAKVYQEAKKSGGINSSNCGDLAGKFADVYEDHPKLPEAKFNEGVIWEECGELAKAEAAYQQVISQHPKFGPALNNLGQLYFDKGKVTQAVDYFKKASDQKASDGYANLAVIQRNRALEGDAQMVKEAVDNIHRALAVDSFNIEAYGTMALVLYDHAKTRSQLEMARLICVQATKVDDKYAPIYNILGLILLRMGRVTPALAEFRKAVALNDDYLEAHMNIGAVTLSFRDYETAERSFSKVLALAPSQKMKAEALVGLGVAYRGQRKFDEAMKQYQAALKLDPNNVGIIYNMGILMQDYTFDASNPAAGIATLQQAAQYLQQYASRGSDKGKVRDARKRIKNINELIPMLQEQQKMMQELQKQNKS